LGKFVINLILPRDEAGIVLQRIFWHRIICDEFHELISDNVATKQVDAKSFFLDNLHGRIFLGLTGTPHYKDVAASIIFFVNL
jgi:superfamily II DNA or RNA helicase